MELGSVNPRPTSALLGASSARPVGSVKARGRRLIAELLGREVRRWVAALSR